MDTDRPPPDPFDVRRLAVGGGHEIYVEQVGNPAGIPLLFLHGGPGSGCRPAQRALFDPSRFRTVLFDQRGAGRSTPADRLDANDTWRLVADIEAIRAALAIERWIVVGGSWGATLGLAYAERHPERVAGLVLRAVFLGTRAELEWAFLEAPARLRPELHADFLELLSDAERADPLRAYWRRILDPDPAIHRPARWRWHDTERVLSEVRPVVSRSNVSHAPHEPLPRTPLFEAHYFANDCFLEPGQLLRDAGRLAGIPGVIVQGRYDLLCPPQTSFALAAAWPTARVVIAENAGHALSEPGVLAAVQAALNELASR
ncbi:MAG: prolyl aminopeptidase [Bauldia sp.]|nr:prolyl aminopeptidase [Bauldia sp.]